VNLAFHKSNNRRQAYSKKKEERKKEKMMMGSVDSGVKISERPLLEAQMVDYCKSQSHCVDRKQLDIDMPGVFMGVSKASIACKMCNAFNKMEKTGELLEFATKPLSAKKLKMDPATMMLLARAGNKIKGEDDGNGKGKQS
jgi:hypothetical protein